MNIISFTDFKIFESNKKKYLYCIKDNKICEIDNKTLALLNEDGQEYEKIKNNLSSLFCEDELDELIKLMTEYGIIENKENKLKNNNDEIFTEISSITMLVAQNCNLRCSYCYADEGKYQNCGSMDINTAKKAIDFLIEKSKSKQLGVCFFGGEPLLNVELIKKIIEYCHKKQKETGKEFGFSMTTNGTLINKEIEDFIIKNKIKVQISIDGDKKNHDSNRYYSGKIGSYETVLKKTEYLRKNGLLDARGTITKKGLDLVYTYDFLKSIDFKSIALSPAFNLLTAKEYDMLADSFIDFYLDFEKRIKEKKYDEVKNNRMFMTQLSDIHYSKIRTKACGAGKNLYAIDINGDIYPCQRFVGNTKMIIGNIFNSNNKQEDFLKKTSISTFKKCSNCWIRNLCVGGCIHDNLFFTGNINEPFELQCKYKKKIITEAINIYLRLSDEELYELFGI